MLDDVYLIDPTAAERNQITEALAGESVTVTTYDSAEAFLAQATEVMSGCVLVPSDLRGMGVRALIRETFSRHLSLAIVIIGRQANLASAVELARAGATDFLEQPFSNGQLRSAVRRALGT